MAEVFSIAPAATRPLWFLGGQAGWFRLRRGNGLLFVTDPSRVVAVPTTDGYVLLASVGDPDAFLEALRRRSTP